MLCQAALDSDLSDADTDAGDAAAAEAALTLDLGSADPHGVGDVDTVPSSQRPRPFAVSAHVPATSSELLLRDFPRANVAPHTDPVDPPPVPASPPRVTRLEQVVPVHTYAASGAALEEATAPVYACCSAWGCELGTPAAAG